MPEVIAYTNSSAVYRFCALLSAIACIAVRRRTGVIATGAQLLFCLLAAAVAGAARDGWEANPGVHSSDAAAWRGR